MKRNLLIIAFASMLIFAISWGIWNRMVGHYIGYVKGVYKTYQDFYGEKHVQLP